MIENFKKHSTDPELKQWFHSSFIKQVTKSLQIMCPAFGDEMWLDLCLLIPNVDDCRMLKKYNIQCSLNINNHSVVLVLINFISDLTRPPSPEDIIQFATNTIQQFADPASFTQTIKKLTKVTSAMFGDFVSHLSPTRNIKIVTRTVGKTVNKVIKILDWCYSWW